MACTRDIRIKVTELQYKIIKSKAELGGYKTISAFIRDCVLNVDYSVEKLVKEIHQMIIEDKKNKII